MDLGKEGFEIGLALGLFIAILAYLFGAIYGGEHGR